MTKEPPGNRISAEHKKIIRLIIIATVVMVLSGAIGSCAKALMDYSSHSNTVEELQLDPHLAQLNRSPISSPRSCQRSLRISWVRARSSAGVRRGRIKPRSLGSAAMTSRSMRRETNS